jgi:SAM-dependent methyltransferase
MANQYILDFVDEFRNLTRTAANEEELRTAFVSAAINKLSIRDLKLERGRQDVRRNRVIIEFKDKGLFQGTKTSAKFQEALNQLVNTYIPNQASQDGRRQCDYIGVCFDGHHLAFAYIEDSGRIRVSDLMPFNEHSAASLVLALNLDDRRELIPQNVVDDFGPSSAITSAVLRALWTHLDTSLTTRVNRVEMLYSEWNDLFEQSTSLGRIGRSRLDTYSQSIGLPGGADPTRVLFVLHTYHALVFKLLAAELVIANALIQGIRTDYCFSTSALDDTALIASLERDIEESELFRQANILNFVEGTFFSWYLVSAPPALVEAIRGVMQLVSLYRLTGLQLTRTRDVVKRVYQQLVPRALRHNIGEFFTPEWLVEFTLDHTGYQNDAILEEKFLDPCCGSGNFLIHAIERYKERARVAGWNSTKILQSITEHIFGFDLNPLAVLTARVNYLIAISDIIATHSDVEIPVYQADAVYAPTVSSNRAKTTRVYQIGTRVQTIDLELPEDLIQRNNLFGRILEIMERIIRQRDTEHVFVSNLNGDAIYSAEPDREMWEPFLRDMFRKVEALERIPWNRIWCRIVRNYFASVAVGKCQFIASNPPWVRWSELPTRYTQRIKPTCDDYHIFSSDRYFGGNELDISGMIAYTVADKWLVDLGGRLSFVITQTHFQSQSSGGFRRFEVKGVPLKVLGVDDFVDVRPFPGLANKPAVLSLEKGSPTTYPVSYVKWKRTTSATIPEDLAWATAHSRLRQMALEANHLSGSGHRWSILPRGRFALLRVLDGEDSNIEGRKGIVTDLNGAYFIELLGPGRTLGTVRFRNSPHEGRQLVPPRTDEIELDLVYPLIKGAKNIRAFFANNSPLYVIIPNKGITMSRIPTVSNFVQNHTRALRYFRAINIDGVLERRSTWRTRMASQYDRLVRQGQMAKSDIPVYAIYDVGDYTFAEYKVVWAEMAGTLQAAVIGNAEVPFGGGLKPIVADHKVYFAAFAGLEYAHYVCALLNSAPIRTFIDSFTIKLQVGTLFRHIRLPIYDQSSQNHQRLEQLSRDAHQILAHTGGTGSIAEQRREIDAIVNRMLA